jgi:hypothetical protein
MPFRAVDSSRLTSGLVLLKLTDQTMRGSCRKNAHKAQNRFAMTNLIQGRRDSAAFLCILCLFAAVLNPIGRFERLEWRQEAPA